MDHQPFNAMWKVMRENKFEITEDERSEYSCIICKNILINACVAPCGCRFCLGCIKEHLKCGKRRCPGESSFCNFEEIDFQTDIQINKLIDRKVSKLSVKCPNYRCECQVELGMIGDHLKVCGNQLETCPYLMLGCEEDKMEIDQMRDHLSMEIHSHSNLLINWIRNSQNEMRSMKSEIDKLKEDNKELKEKMKSDGEQTRKFIQHLEKRGRETISESKYLNEEMCALKNSIRTIKSKLKSSKEKQKQQIEQLEAKIKSQNLEIEHLKSENKIRSEEIVTLKLENRNQSEEIVTLKERCQSIESKWIQTNQRQKKKNDKSKKTKKSIEALLTIIDQITYAYFLWEIDNFSQIVTKTQSSEDVRVASDSFFTHQNGYNIFLAAVFNESYFVIYFHIKRGPFDDYLQWPFDRDVECSVVNQKTGLGFKSIIIKSSNVTNNFALQKPKGEKSYVAFHFDIRLSPEEILQNPEVCQKDRISIRFTSKPSDNPR